MDPNIGKATTGKERTVAACKESLPTSRGPHRIRFLEVQAEIRARMVSDRNTLLGEAAASTKRNLMSAQPPTDIRSAQPPTGQPALVTLRYCDGMKGDTLPLVYNLLLELDTTYSKPMKGLDEKIRKKLHNVFMSRWSAFHAPVHSAAFAMDRQFCRRDMHVRVKKDIWSVMEDFSKAPGGKDLSKMKAQ